MGVLSCPYRGEQIPGLFVKKTQAAICNHPEVRGPCVIAGSLGSPIPNCVDCQRWRDSQSVAAEKLAGLVQLDPATWAGKPVDRKAARKSAAAARVASGKPPPPPVLECIHRGDYTGQTADCPTGCKAKFKIFACDVHGECTLYSKGVGVEACCQGCGEREEAKLPVAAVGRAAGRS